MLSQGPCSLLLLADRNLRWPTCRYTTWSPSWGTYTPGVRQVTCTAPHCISYMQGSCAGLTATGSISEGPKESAQTGGAQQRIRNRGCTIAGAQQRVHSRGCATGVHKQGVAHTGGAQQGVLKQGVRNRGAQQGVHNRAEGAQQDSSIISLITPDWPIRCHNALHML